MTETNEKPKRAVRPRDAATLVLVRREAGGLRVLMGQRHRGHRFMPEQYVFPGGRVDRHDGYAPALTPLRPAVQEKLCLTASTRRAQALALAAVRETFEETGLILGRPVERPPARLPESWRPFFATGYGPALDALSYVCHAITPPFRPQRFNARFFLADASQATGTLGGSGELLYLDWIDPAEALKLPIPNITRIVLEQVQDLAAASPDDLDRRPVPLHHSHHGKRVIRWL